VGHLPKDEVRRLAREAGLPTAAKKDSTGICFIGERDFRAFLGSYLPAQPGEILSVDGTRVGEHAGAWFYTLGQREGLHVGGVRGRPAAPWFVVAKDVARNRLYVDQGPDSPWLQSSHLTTEPVHWVAGEAPAAPLRCTAKTRYRQTDQACLVQWDARGQLSVAFDTPQRAVTPGQSIVLYLGDQCLGGAVILSTDAPAVPDPLSTTQPKTPNA
jgi:tRNA-specific 2-thiouridylase